MSKDSKGGWTTCVVGQYELSILNFNTGPRVIDQQEAVSFLFFSFFVFG